MWSHDCDRCRQLGQTLGGMRVFDLYVCGKSGRDTLIARYGNRGEDYLSIDSGYATPQGHAELWAAQCIFQVTCH